MKEKPDVISAEEIDNYCATHAKYKKTKHLDTCITAERCTVCICETQRDADVAWCEQAKADIAREIFEEAEQRCVHLHARYRHMPKRDCPVCWQSLKDKCLKEAK